MYDIKFSRDHSCYHSYASWCNSFKNNETSRKIGHQTWVRYNNGVIEFIYWSTIVLTVDANNHWRYNTGGWETYTTKRRFNVLGPAYVYQKDGLWWFNDTKGNTWRYKEDMVLDCRAMPVKEGPWLMNLST